MGAEALGPPEWDSNQGRPRRGWFLIPGGAGLEVVGEAALGLTLLRCLWSVSQAVFHQLRKGREKGPAFLLRRKNRGLGAGRKPVSLPGRARVGRRGRCAPERKGPGLAGS